MQAWVPFPGVITLNSLLCLFNIVQDKFCFDRDEEAEYFK